MTQPIAFLMCTEGGQLEQESQLMVRSFRKYAGTLSQAPIYSFHVRQQNPPSQSAIATLESLGVKHQQVILNTRYPNYPLANKPLLCAHAEQTIDADILVFLDSDLVFFSEPTECLLSEEYDVGIRPEHHKMIGSEGSADPNEAYWRRLHSIAGSQHADRFVTTTVDQKHIRAFWNSGVVSVRRSVGIFAAWQQTLDKLLEPGAFINKDNFYYEQSALSATICAMTDRVLQFSPGYNYPIHSHNEMIEIERRNSFEQIVCIHDHLFRARKEKYRERTWVKTLKRLQCFEKGSERYRWLYQYLSEHNPKPNLSQSLLEDILFLPGIKRLVPYRH